MAGGHTNDSPSQVSTEIGPHNFGTGRRDEKGDISYAPAEIARMVREGRGGFDETRGYFPGMDMPPVPNIKND